LNAVAAGPEILVRYIRRLATRAESDQFTDSALLDRFITDKDETAFARLVDRHGPLVFHVCRRVLGDVHDAEDAFQAAFLVLARKANSVRPREALPAWLHGVAHRVALKARSARIRRLRLAEPLAVPPATDPRADPLAELSARDLLSIVDEEVRRLPDVYRLPVILCCLEGRSQEEAARQLGWTAGSVKGRLERGRVRLHRRLVRRGLTLSVALAGVELSRSAAASATVTRLAASTVRGAILFAAGTAVGGGASTHAVALAVGVLQSASVARMKLAASLVLAICLATTGFFLHHDATKHDASAPDSARSADDGDQHALLSGKALAADNALGEPLADEDVPIEVNGRVLDPKGRPCAGAKIYVGYGLRTFPPAIEGNAPIRQVPCALRATSDADGRFHFAFTQSELDARFLDDARPAVVAVAGDNGPDWRDIKETLPSEPGHAVDLTLQLVEDQPVTGRILDSARKPVAGAKVVVRTLTHDSEEGMNQLLRGEFSSRHARCLRGVIPGQPPSVTTDADGRFRLTGLGRDRLVDLAVEGPEISDAMVTAIARPAPNSGEQSRIRSAEFEFVALPRKLIRGTVRDKATGKPVAGVQMSVYQARTTTLSDADGHYEIVGCPKGHGYLVKAQPRDGLPYFASAVCVQKATDEDPLIVDIDLTAGIVLTGKVTDQSTQKPPRSAVVEYYPLFPNPHSAAATNGLTMAASSAIVQADGSYRLIVLPGPGVVCVAASPRPSYATAMIEEKELAELARIGIADCASWALPISVGDGRKMGLLVSKYSAVSVINPKDSVEALVCDLATLPARTVKGTVVGPDDKPLDGVDVVGLTAQPDEEMLDGAAFTVTGLHPRGTREVSFLQSDKQLAKVMTIRGDEVGPLKVRLEPCGWVNGRFVDKNGNPKPGVVFFAQSGSGLDQTSKSDKEGRFRVALVPGRNYFLNLYSHRTLGNVGAFNVESGQTKELGDVPLAD
jgi:RNA polymerase sigma factor (sigma-70 family)